jgi:hypothetical protein
LKSFLLPPNFQFDENDYVFIFTQKLGKLQQMSGRKCEEDDAEDYKLTHLTDIAKI